MDTGKLYCSTLPIGLTDQLKYEVWSMKYEQVEKLFVQLMHWNIQHVNLLEYV